MRPRLHRWLLGALLACAAGCAAAQEPRWFDAGRPSAQAQQAVQLLLDAAAQGLEPRDYAAAELQQALINQGVPVSAIPTQARVSALALKMAEELAPGGDARAQDEALGTFLVNIGEEINLTVNPRFGQWQAEELTVVPTPDLLSRPADNAFALEESFSVN